MDYWKIRKVENKSISYLKDLRGRVASWGDKGAAYQATEYSLPRAKELLPKVKDWAKARKSVSAIETTFSSNAPGVITPEIRSAKDVVYEPGWKGWRHDRHKRSDEARMNARVKEMRKKAA